MTSYDDESLNTAVARLTLEQKVQLLTGRDLWSTWPIPEIGLRAIVVSDGPSGVRGQTWDERDPSLNLPSATALSSAWSPQMARRYGAMCAAEARRKGVDVVLGPTINLHRSPLGGRHFEAYSEDPLLTGDLAAAYVAGLQENGVGAALKHYVCNDFETERLTADVEVSDRALRELYLPAFERAIVESGSWLVMSAYNKVNGSTATENELLAEPLNGEWGFDGVVISDWGAVRSLDSARFPQDLVMPGPKGPWGDALVAAVSSGEIEEATVDRKVLRILRLAARVGALDGFEPAASARPPAQDGSAFAREAAVTGSVLVRNEGELPWAREGLDRIAVIGQSAKEPRTQGGGSATVIPPAVVSPLEGIRQAFPEAEVTHTTGTVVSEGMAPLPLDRLRNPVTGEPGVRVRYLDADERELDAEDRFSTALHWFGGDSPVERAARVHLDTAYTPDETGTVRLGFAAAGAARVLVDGRTIVERAAALEGVDIMTVLFDPPSTTGALEVTAGVAIDIRVEYDLPEAARSFAPVHSLLLGLEHADTAPDQDVAEAVAAARAADVAVVVVGTSAAIESEGFDRASLDLPGRQNELVSAVAAANPRTVAVVNAGAPVLMPWRDEVAAVLVSYFPGQEFGHALADVLTGDAEPGGRLPTTWPARAEDTPVLDVTPVDGRVSYDEGVHTGYRAWLRTGAVPAYPFGHGLGYTTWQVSDVTAPGDVAPGEAFEVAVEVTNTGSRTGRHVLQVYAERPESGVDRPVRWLVGFSPVTAAPGQTVRLSIPVHTRSFAHWDGGWTHEPGAFTLRVGGSSADLPHSRTVSLLPPRKV